MPNSTKPKSNIRKKARQGIAAALAFIEEQIASGVWEAGEQLPPERELVERFGVSRNTLRKGMKELEHAGKIARHVGRGTFVTRGNMIPAKQDPQSHQGPPASGRTDAAGRDALTQKIHRASPSEVMDLRLMLEPQSGELAASRATMDDLALMEHCLRGGEEAKSVADFEEWDGRLHQTIVACARNQLLSDIYEAINGVRRTAQWGTLKERTLTSERRASYIRQHRAIVTALRERDSGRARQEIRDHLIAVKESLGAV